MLNTKKPTFEKIEPGFGSSIYVKQHSEKVENSFPYWHFHPEIELLYVNRGQGKRHIGNHLSYFNNSQLILIGSNLPHNGFADRFTTSGKETIIQFKPDFMGAGFLDLPEVKRLKLLLERAKSGVVFKPETKRLVGPKIEGLVNIKGFERLHKFLEILNDLSIAEDYLLLNVEGFAIETNMQDSAKIDKIYKHVNTHFQEPIPLDEIADKAGMTVPAFCRFFKKSTGKTFTKLVNEYRVVHATKLLAESDMSITDVCFECGFNNFSHFNKLFKDITGKSASKYRNEMKKMIQIKEV